MSRVCELTGKRVASGNNVSHSNRHTKRTFRPNLRPMSFWSPVLSRPVRARVSAHAIRCVERVGDFDAFLQMTREGFLSQRMRRVRRLILQKTIDNDHI